PLLRGGSASGRPGDPCRPTSDSGQHDFPGYGGHPGWRDQSGLPIHQWTAAAHHRRGLRRHPGSGTDCLGHRPALAPGRTLADAVELQRFQNQAHRAASQRGAGGRMNLIAKALEWISSAEQWQGDSGLQVLLGQHLLYTALAVLLASLVAIPAGWAIGHTGKGREIAVAAAGIARAVPSFGLLILLV